MREKNMKWMLGTFGMAFMGAALMLAGCTTGVDTPVNGPAPPGEIVDAPAPAEATLGKLAILKGTHVDNEALRTAWVSLRAVRSVSTAMRAVGVLKPGTPLALSVAEGLDSTRRWLNAATEMQRLGEADKAYAAFQQAEAAYVSILSALGR